MVGATATYAQERNSSGMTYLLLGAALIRQIILLRSISLWCADDSGTAVLSPMKSLWKQASAGIYLSSSTTSNKLPR